MTCCPNNLETLKMSILTLKNLRVNYMEILLKKFTNDLCETFLAADIPFNKLSNVKVKEFLENYTGKAIPDPSNIRKYYVQRVYDENKYGRRQTDRKYGYLWMKSQI